MNDTRKAMIATGLIHNGPMTYPPGHPLRGNGPTGPKLSATELDRRGFPVASRAKVNRSLGLVGLDTLPAFWQ